MTSFQNNLFNQTAQIIRWPKKPEEKLFVVQYLSDKFISDRYYSEKEVNEIIENHHAFNDIALLRRELVGRKYLDRRDNGSQYWKIS